MTDAGISDFGFRISDFGFRIHSAAGNLPSHMVAAIRNPQSAIRNLQSAIRNLQSAICNPQSAICNPQSAICLLCLLAFALRVVKLNVPDLWADEAWNVGVAVQALATILDILAHDVYPPLYPFLLHAWIGLAGASAFAARFLSLVFSVLTIALTYRIGRRGLGAGVGLLAAGIVALSHLDVYYAREAKDLTMVTFLGLLSLWFLLRALAESRWRDWIGYILAAAASLYTFYYAAFVLLAMNVVALVWLTLPSVPPPLRGACPPQREGRGEERRWLLAQLGVGLWLLPWLLYAVPPLVARWGSLKPGTQQPGALFIFDVWAGAFVPGFALGFEFRLPALLLGLLGLGLALLARFRRPSSSPHPLPLPISGEGGGQGVGEGAMLLAVALLPTILTALATRVGGSFHVRYLLPTFPAWALLVAGTVRLLARWHPAVSLTVGALILVSLVGGLPQAYPATKDVPDFASATTSREIVAYLHDRAGPADLILAETPSWTGVLHSIYPGPPPACAPLATDTPPDTLAYQIAGHEQVWVLPLPGQNRLAGSTALAGLDAQTYRVEEIIFADTVVRRYLVPAAATVDRPWVVQFGESLTTASYALDDRAARPGGSLGVRIGWQTLRAVGYDVHLSLRLVGTDGQAVAQWDGQLVAGWPTSQWPTGAAVHGRYGLALPPTIAPGDYIVTMVVYERDTGWPLTVTDPATGQPSDHAILTTIQVRP